MFTIMKKGREYVVFERQNKWEIKRRDGKLEVVVNVPKTLCATEADVREYVIANDVFAGGDGE